MKHLLLTLSAATLLTLPALAQEPSAPVQLASQLVSHQRPGAALKLSAPTLATVKKALAPAKALATGKHSLADATRSPLELSYQVNGDEINNAQPIAVIEAGMLKQNGYDGYGLASLFDSDMLSRYVGNTIGKINFACWNATYADMKAFILNANTGEMLWSADVANPATVDLNKNNALGGQPNSVDCDYVIKDSTPLFIGWMAKSTAKKTDAAGGKYDVIMPSYVDNTGAGQGAYVFIRTSKGQYGIATTASEVQDQQGNPYNVSAYITVETTGKGGLKQNDAQPVATSFARGLKSLDNAKTQLRVANLGLAPMKSFDYTIDVNGQQKSGTYTFENPVGFYQYGVAQLAAPLNTTSGSATGTLTVTKVNSVDDEYTADNDNVAAYRVLTMDKAYNRMPVVEEFTSTTCGWCPYGIAGLKRTSEALDGNVVLIGIHTDYQKSLGTDPLIADGYADYVKAAATSFPSVMVNREYTGHAYNDAPTLAKHAATDLAEANLVVTSGAMPTNKLTKTFDVTTKLTFTVPVAEGDYGLSYVVTEDGVTGVEQLNYFKAQVANYTQQGYTEAQVLKALGWDKDEDLTYFAKTGTYDRTTGSYWFEPTFDHVASGVSSWNGAADLVPATEAGKEITLTKKVTIPTRTSPAVVNKNLKVAVLLIHQPTGLIVTGAQVAPSETSKPTGIDEAATTAGTAEITAKDGAFNVKAANATAQVFTADGKLVTSATVKGEASLPTFGKGVFVIRVTEGSHVTTQKAVF